MIHVCQYCHEDYDTTRPHARTCPACKARLQASRKRILRATYQDPIGSCGQPQSSHDEKLERLADRAGEVRRRAECYRRHACPLCGHTLAPDSRDPSWLRCQRPECGHLAPPEAIPPLDGPAPTVAPAAPSRPVCTKCGAPRLHTHVPKAAAGLGLCRECARPYRLHRAAKNLPMRLCRLCRQPTRAKGGFCRVCAGLRLEVVEKSA